MKIKSKNKEITIPIEFIGEIYKLTNIERVKIKGDKHSNTKVKTPKKVDNVKLQKINDIAVKVLPSWRLDQMYTEVMDILNGGIGDIKKIGNFLKAVVQDVHKEDLDIIIESGFEPKEINGAISKIAKEWLFARLDEEV